MKKLFEKLPIKCDFARFCSICDPAVILSCEAEVLQKRFKSLLNQFMISIILSPNQCDSITLEFTSFIGNELQKYRAKVEEFNENHNWSDNFCFNQVFANNYAGISHVIKVFLTLSHGRASTEQQFSITNIVLDNNRKEESVVAKQHITDQLWSKK